MLERTVVAGPRTLLTICRVIRELAWADASTPMTHGSQQTCVGVKPY